MRHSLLLSLTTPEKLGTETNSETDVNGFRKLAAEAVAKYDKIPGLFAERPLEDDATRVIVYLLGHSDLFLGRQKETQEASFVSSSRC